MALYLTIEDMIAVETRTATAADPSAPNENVPFLSNELYPSVASCPEYSIHDSQVPENTTNNIQDEVDLLESKLRAPISLLSGVLEKVNLTHGIKKVYVPKYKETAKCGIRLIDLNNCIYVQFVMANSPGARNGIRFGDQVLHINDQPMHRLTNKKAMTLMCQMGTGVDETGLSFTIRDRPLCSMIVLHRTAHEATGFGFELKSNIVTRVMPGTSAALNGLSTNMAVVEIDGTCVVGNTTEELEHILQTSPNIIALTLMPRHTFETFTEKISPTLLSQQNHCPPLLVRQ